MTTSLNEPTGLSEMVNFQDEAIVSRLILKNTGGNVTLFAFASGQSLSEHTTPHDALVFVIEGEGVFDLDGSRKRVQSGQMLLLPANIPHAVYAEKPFKMMLTMIKGANPDHAKQ